MIGHHDGIVDDKAQRDGDSGQRIQLHFQSEQIIEDHGDAQVYTQADDNQNQVTEIPGDHENEEQQDQNGQSGAHINLVQFFLDVFRGVIAGMYFVTRRKVLLDVSHFLLDLLGQLQLVGRLFCPDGKIDGIQSVDTIIALRLFFLPGYFQELVQAEQFPLRRLDRDLCRVESFFRMLRDQCQTHPVLFVRIVRQVGDAQEFFLVIGRDGSLNILYGDAQFRKLPAVVFQSPFHRSRSADLNPIDALNGAQVRFDLVLGIPLDEYRRGRRIEGINQERA